MLRALRNDNFTTLACSCTFCEKRVSLQRFIMFSMLIEVILQGGIFFSVLLYLHPIIVEGINWHASCIYLFTCHPKWFCNSTNESYVFSECSRRDYFRFLKIVLGFLNTLPQTAPIFMIYIQQSITLHTIIKREKKTKKQQQNTHTHTHTQIFSPRPLNAET